MGKFSDWLGLMESSVSDTSDAVMPEEIDTTIQTLHALLQEHSEKQPAFIAIYDNIKKMTSTAVPQEADRLNAKYTTLAARYQVC